jgi:hypothetical protein
MIPKFLPIASIFSRIFEKNLSRGVRRIAKAKDAPDQAGDRNSLGLDF